MADSPPFTIHPATPADVPGLIEVFFASFKSDRSEKLIPSTSEGREWLSKCYMSFVNPEPGRPRSRVLVAKDESSGVIVGMLLFWVIHGGEGGGLGLVTRYQHELAPSMSRERLMEWSRPMEEDNRKYMGNDAQIFLETLAVSEACRGQGLGGRLVRAVTEVADDLGYPVYLDSAVKAVPVYERCGFLAQPQGGSRSIPMRRPSKIELAQ